MKAYFASPYASYIGTRQAAVNAAMGAVHALPLRTVLHVDEVALCPVPCVWSPLLHGQFLLWQRGGNFSEEDALEWCLECLENHFDTLILSTSIPRKQGYGENGMDKERELAERLGYRIIPEIEVWREVFG